MKNIILAIFFVLLFSGDNAQMTVEEREMLLKKTAIHINEKNFLLKKKDLFTYDNSFKYDINKIKEIINKYKFPENYNFTEEENITVIIKNQESCGSCWSFASTTALSYRFNKKNIRVNLSPQEPLSCFHPDCDVGMTGIGAQLNLVKNGTVTEECMPYTSNLGKVEECSTTCKGGSEKKKYYAKNAYSIEPKYEEEYYYDSVAVIMDQLINYGPVVSSIICYEDFQKGKFDIYSYDGVSSNNGGHAIVIVGYGFYNNKYYWLIQNSWGEGWGENGFAKIEFAQVGIENVEFAEPNIIEETFETKDISVKLLNTIENSECFINFNTDSSNEDIKNNFELVFKNKKNNDKIYYYCGVVPLIKEDSHICVNDLNYTLSEGVYELYNFSSLGKENIFKINNEKFNFILKNDVFYTIRYKDNQKLYVSESGSKILIVSYLCDECIFKTNIYPNFKATKPFDDCKQINFNDLELGIKYYLVSCSIKKNELNYFDYSYNNGDNSLMSYDRFCNKRFKMNATIYLLDKAKYPLLRVKDFIIPDEDTLVEESIFTLIADVEGSVSGFTSINNLFYVFIDIVNNNKKKTYQLYCMANNIKIISNYKIYCSFLKGSLKNSISYENIILYPYTHQIDTQPYEIIIPKAFQIEKPNDSEDLPQLINPSKKKSSGSWLSLGAITGIVIGAAAVLGF